MPLAALILALALVCAAPANAESVLEQNWDSGAGAWTTSGFWHVQTNPQAVSVLSPTISPALVTIPGDDLPSAFSGNGVAWFGEAATGTFCGASFVQTQPAKSGCGSTGPFAGQLTSPSFSLVGAQSAILRFRSWWEIEGTDADDFDLMEVEYSTDGGSVWTPAGKLNPADNPASAHHESYSNNGLLAEPDWKNYLVDLSGAIGSSTVRIRFDFNTVDSAYNGFRGWLVDDVVVSTPFDADAPVITSVNTCNGLKPAPIWTAHGSNFVQGSVVKVNGAVDLGANIPAPDRIELNSRNAGSYTLVVVSPNGTESAPFPFAAQNCAGQGGGPSGGEKRPTKTQVFCNYIVASETDTCTATVADATGGGTIPTGTVKFTSGNGGAFQFGSACTLTKTPLSTVSSCKIEGFIPPKGKPLAVTGTYSGDAKLKPSSGVTQFLMAAPGNGAYLQTIKPFEGFGPGYKPPTVTVEVDNPVGGTNVEGGASVSTNGSVCNSGLGSSSRVSAAAMSPAMLAAIAAAPKGKSKGKRKVVKVPGLKYKAPKKAKKIKAVVVKKVKRNAKAGKVKLKLKLSKRKLAKLFGKAKRLNLIVRVKLTFDKGQPLTIFRTVKLKKGKGGKYKVVGGKKGGSKKGAKKSSIAQADGRRPVVAEQSQANQPIYNWVGQNECNTLTMAAQFDQGDAQPPLVGFMWQGQMNCLDGSTVPFTITPDGGAQRGSGAGNGVGFSFAKFGDPGYTLSGTLFGGSGNASGKAGGTIAGNPCQATAPQFLTQLKNAQ
jgi:hypothetical protein